MASWMNSRLLWLRILLCQRSRAFLFLNEIQRRFITSKQTEDFTTTLAAEMYRYSEDYSTIVIRKGELDELNSIGVGCSESLLGEKILYINNPDIISYSTVSNVIATPGLISVSGVSPTQQEISLSTSTTGTIPVMSSSPERKLNIMSQPQSVTVLDSPPDRKPPNSSAQRRADSQTSKNISVEQISPTSDRISAVSPNQERISTISPFTDSSPVMSPRLYIVIVGMIILVIAMAVYALGPVSCVVVTGVGMYSLLRSYMETKDKAN